MMRIVIEITDAKVGGNEFGAGVNVETDRFDPKNVPASEGQTWVGICTAINEYMRSRGAPDFDCLRRHAQH